MSKAVHQMFADIAPRYDFANDVLSFGMHRLWRSKALKLAGTRSGQAVVDLCCGTGDVSFAAARLVGHRGKVWGIDFVEEMLQLAEQKKSRQDLSNITFLQADALALPLPDDCADLATVSFGIRNVDDPLLCLKEMKRVVRPGGKILVLEFGQPSLPGYAHLYRLYCRHLMPRIGGLLTGNRAAYEYLPNTSRAFPAGRAFLELMEQAALEELTAVPLLGRIAYIYLAKVPVQDKVPVQNAESISRPAANK